MPVFINEITVLIQVYVSNGSTKITILLYSKADLKLKCIPDRTALVIPHP
jgi:hypothetical protein